MNFIKLIVACCATLFLLLSNQLLAAQCSAVFPDVIATHGNGNGNGNSQINFGYNAHLINNPDTELSTQQVSHNSGSNINSCASADCTASNNSAEAVSVNFKRGGGTVNYSPPSNQTTTFGIRGANNYRNITARSDATMQFGDNYDVYFFENLSLGFRNTLNLAAGKTYYFRKFTVGSNVKINVIGSGTATVFVDAGVNFISPAMINSPGENRSGDVSKLVMHTKGNVTFGSGSTFSGALYAKNITFTSASYLFGVASGQKVTLGSNSVLTYDSTVFDANFGEICDHSVPAVAIANFQFDKCEYTGTDNIVIDQLGRFNASASSGVASASDSTINRSLDLTAQGIGDWVTIPNDAIDGLNDFSISVWINTSVSKSQQEIFHALGSSASDDEVELYLVNSSTLNIKLKGRAKNFSTGRSVTNGQWHHLVVTRVQDDICLYVNGSIQDCDDGFPNRDLSVPNSNAVVLGQEQDTYGGRFDSGQSFEGKLDELIIFDGALTADEVTTIYDHQSTGNNYDGSSRDADQCSVLIAQFSMEQLSWGDKAGEVIDELGSFNARAKNGALTVNVSPAKPANPGTCRYGSFDGVNDYIELPSTFENLRSSFTIAAWIKPSNIDSGSRIFADDEKNQTGYALSLGDQNSNTGHLRFYSRGVQPVSLDTAAGVISPDKWVFVTAVHNSVTKSRQIYVDGILKASGIYRGNWGTDSGPASIGGETDRGETNNRFTGDIDEVHIFKGALTVAEINEVRDKTHPCADPVIHHYEIVHDGNGLTCAAEPITIKACTNSSCSNLSTESVSLDFTVNGVTKSPVTFTGSTDNNNPSFSFNHTTPETLTLSIASATVPATNPVQCTGSSCDMRFSDSEFRFLYGANNDSTIASQISGVVFNGLKIQARKDENGECKGLFSGVKNIELWQENLPTDSSDTNTGLEFQIAGDDIGKNSASARRIVLNFTTDSTGAESIATIPTSAYLDAGKIRLRASYNQNDVSLVGNSNEFWVKPAKLIMSARKTKSTIDINGSSPDNTIEQGKRVHPAGAVFDFAVEALNSRNNRVENYRQGDGKLQLKVIRQLPSNTGTVNGSFTYSTDAPRESAVALLADYADVILASFSADNNNIGLSKYTGAKFSEVGIINVDIQDINYGGLGVVDGSVSGDDITIGRFTPAYFKQTVNSTGNLDAKQSDIFKCKAVDWAYTGQTEDDKGVIYYGTKPSIIITAYNNDDVITENYTLGYSTALAASFMKLTTDKVKITKPKYDAFQQQRGVDPLEVDPQKIYVNIVSEMSSGKLTAGNGLGLIAGQWLYTFSEDDYFTYVRDHSSFLKPFSANIPFVVSEVSDGDGIVLGQDPITKDTFKTSFETTGLEVRFARMVLDNAHGPENSTLRSPIHIEVFNGTDSAYTNFSKAVDESCLIPTIKDKKPGNKYSGNMNQWDYRLIDIDNTDGLEVENTRASITGGVIAGSHNNLFFSAPSKQGVLEFEYQVPDWLKFDWKNEDSANNGPHDVNPSAILNFGRYRGNDRIISWREVSE